jgi:hypothetical protein
LLSSLNSFEVVSAFGSWPFFKDLASRLAKEKIALKGVIGIYLYLYNNKNEKASKRKLKKKK